MRIKSSTKKLQKEIEEQKGIDGNMFIQNNKTGAIVLLNTKTGELRLIRTALSNEQVEVGIRYIEEGYEIKNNYLRNPTKNNIILSNNWYDYNSKNPSKLPTDLANPKDYPYPPYN